MLWKMQNAKCRMQNDANITPTEFSVGVAFWLSGGYNKMGVTNY